MLNLPLQAFKDQVVLLRDVATVKNTFKTAEKLARVNGKPAINIQIKKKTGENIISVTQNVKALLREAAKQFPQGIHYETAQDKSTQITSLLGDLSNNIATAIILVISVVLIFLGLSSGFLVGVSIPGSFLSGVLILYLSGFSVNVVVLFSLILSVGLLVDGSIVVAEYAARRLREGATRLQAYDEAARKMSWPIIASTATTLAAFFPLVFWPGTVGEFMKFLPITLIAVLLSSLVMALLFLPVLGTWLNTFGKTLLYLALLLAGVFAGSYGAIEIGGAAPIGALVGFMGVFLIVIVIQYRQNAAKRKEENEDTNADIIPVAMNEEAQQNEVPQHENEVPQHAPKVGGLVFYYLKVLRVFLLAPTYSIIFVLFILGSVFYTYTQNNNGIEFFPSSDPDRFNLDIAARGNLSLLDQEDIIKQVEAIALKFKQKYEGIDSVMTIIGGGSEQSADDVIGQLQIELVDWQERPTADTIIKPILKEIREIKGIRVEAAKEQQGPRANKPVNLRLQHEDRQKIYEAGRAIVKDWGTDDSLSISWTHYLHRVLTGSLRLTVKKLQNMVLR